MSIALTELNTSIEYAFPMLAVLVIIIGAFSREKALVFKKRLEDRSRLRKDIFFAIKDY